MDSLFEWGIIVRPQGIRGGMKVDTDLNDPAFLSRIHTVFIRVGGEMKPYGVRTLKMQNQAVIMELENTDDRNAAEAFRGKTLFLTRSDHPLPENTNLISDLIGCRIIGINSQNNIGTVKDVSRFPAQDVYTYTDGQHEWMIPALKTVFPTVDVESRTIYANEALLLQTSVMQER